MSRPKGSKNRPKEEKLTETAVNAAVDIQAEVNANADVREEKEEREEVLKQEAPKLEPLAPGQAYFEAPTGELLIGDATSDRLWFRPGNDGRGMWINRKR